MTNEYREALKRLVGAIDVYETHAGKYGDLLAERDKAKALLAKDDPNECPECLETLDFTRGPLGTADKHIHCPNCKWEPIVRKGDEK